MDRETFLSEVEDLAVKLPAVVVDATSAGELRDVVSELPKDEGYGELLALADE